MTRIFRMTSAIDSLVGLRNLDIIKVKDDSLLFVSLGQPHFDCYGILDLLAGS